MSTGQALPLAVIWSQIKIVPTKGMAADAVIATRKDCRGAKSALPIHSRLDRFKVVWIYAVPHAA